MSPMMEQPEPAGLDLAAEYRGLSAWGAALEARHAALIAIADQINTWIPLADTDAAAVPAEAYELMWSAYEAEHAALNEEFLLLDVGFEVLAQAAERLGIDLDELDDEPGRPWDQDPDRA